MANYVKGTVTKDPNKVLDISCSSLSCSYVPSALSRYSL